MQASTCNFIRKETLAQVFFCEFAKFIWTPFLQNTSWRLLSVFSHHFQNTSWSAVLSALPKQCPYRVPYKDFEGHDLCNVTNDVILNFVLSINIYDSLNNLSSNTRKLLSLAFLLFIPNFTPIYQNKLYHCLVNFDFSVYGNLSTTLHAF